jgi:diguanylate cyclase (GGDEF)-like protein
MTLDPATLVIVACIMSVVVSALLFFSWLQDRCTVALRWWSAAFLIAAAASLLFLAGGEEMRSTGRELANALFALGYGVSYAAARRFNERAVSWPVLAIGPVAWFAAAWGFDFGFVGRVVVMSLLAGGYGFATAYELWNGPERLISQRAAAVVTALNAAYYFVRLITGPAIIPRFDWAQAVDSAWVSMLGLVILLYVMIFGFLIMSMAKEKTDLEHRRAATLDPLTGVANRRGFMTTANRMLEASARRGEPVAVLLFDLDHFKAINDRFGHKTGDDTLVEFCAAAGLELPPDSLFGRMGGEEFAAVLTGRDALTVVDFADRIRKRFAGSTRLAREHDATPTVSVGVAVGGSRALIETLLADADRALYRAKEAGRNRVITSEGSADRAAPVAAPALQLKPALG